ncbi:MAG: hypothetical protein HY013_05445 [Candidatus Solibacter usitatus]|nr:hypothetical protein [Candidatus Solibacter usitatus]
MINRAISLLLAAGLSPAQDFTQRGFLETRGAFYPRTVAGDSAQAVGEALFRYEASYKAGPSLQFYGAFDARSDTHQQTERRWTVSWQDRERQRPPLSVRRLQATWHRGPVTANLGKQFIRWGRTDILNPTDRFAPRDYLAVLDNDFLAVTAVRITVDSGQDSWDAVYVPRFTPSRTPLLGQRWAPLPEDLPRGFELGDGGALYPGGPQFGARWSRTGSRLEGSLCFYEGFNHLPLIDGKLVSLTRAEVRRFYPKMRMYGGDLAAPLPWFTVKAEAAYFSGDSRADEYVLYVVQAERLVKEWVFVGGYAGERVTRRRSPLEFAPDRGLTRAFLGRAGYTIDPNRSVAFDAAARQNGEGVWLRFEYSQAFGQHVRATVGYAWIHGAAADFLGGYSRNSHGTLTVRYSF